MTASGSHKRAWIHYSGSVDQFLCYAINNVARTSEIEARLMVASVYSVAHIIDLLYRRRLLKLLFHREGKLSRDAWRNRVEIHIVSRADIFHSPKEILQGFSVLRRSAHYTLISIHVCKIGALDSHVRPLEQFHAGSMHSVDAFTFAALRAIG